VCAKAFECCTEEELDALALVGESESQCRLAIGALLGLYAVEIQASIDAGRARYDGEGLADCIESPAELGCDMLPGRANPGILSFLDAIGCPGVMSPLVEMGETCGAHHECLDGYCDGATQAWSPTGTCAATKANGEDCTLAEECEGGACSPTDGCEPVDDTPICGA
jgi:hypothetical protein